MGLWSRAPIYFPSMVVQMLPLRPQARAAIAQGRLPREVQFKVAPQHSKVGAPPGRLRPGRAAPTPRHPLPPAPVSVALRPLRPSLPVGRFPTPTPSAARAQRLGVRGKLGLRRQGGGAQVEIKRYLETVYGLRIKSVNTANFEGKVKRRKFGMSKMKDWKKAFVSLEPGPYSPGG